MLRGYPTVDSYSGPACERYCLVRPQLRWGRNTLAQAGVAGVSPSQVMATQADLIGRVPPTASGRGNVGLSGGVHDGII